MLYPKREQDLTAEDFQDPTSEYRGTPFWAWNNKLDADELVWQIEQLKKLGFGGFHMHVRTGMATEYLSDEYMGIARACMEKARAEKMLAWLYDENRWPSGAADGSRWLFIAHADKPVNPDLLHGGIIHIRVKGEWAATYYDTISGAIRPQPVAWEHGDTIIVYALYEHDSLLFKLNKGVTPVAAPEPPHLVSGEAYPNDTRGHMMAESRGGELTMSVSAYRGHLLRLKVDGEDQGVIAYSPYRLTVTGLKDGLHRLELLYFGWINTFGQLHTNVRDSGYWWGVDSWCASGSAWTYEYRFWKQGVLKSPEVYTK